MLSVSVDGLEESVVGPGFNETAWARLGRMEGKMHVSSDVPINR